MKNLSQFSSKASSFKFIIYLSLILFISGNCVQIKNRNVSEFPSQGYSEFSYYPNGQQEYSAEYLNGKLDGMSRHWSEDGYLISESEYSHGKLHGVWKKYYENGNTRYAAHYFHGQKHGEEIWYYENGHVKSEQSFHYGVSAGTIIRWHPDGSIIY